MRRHKDLTINLGAQLLSKRLPSGRTTRMFRHALYARMCFLIIKLAHTCSLLMRRMSFHPLTNRKHHCRLCGRVVCSLPPKPPARPATCSLLIVADPRTRRIEEVPDVIAYGVTLEDKHGEREKYVKGVRICRTCRSVVAYVVCLFRGLNSLIYGTLANNSTPWKLRLCQCFQGFIT